METSKICAIETGYRIQLPAGWAAALGLNGSVLLTKTPAGILVSPAPAMTWDEVFADKLTINQITRAPEHIEVGKDDLLF